MKNLKIIKFYEFLFIKIFLNIIYIKLKYKLNKQLGIYTEYYLNY